jgi:hypothetical protein
MTRFRAGQEFILRSVRPQNVSDNPVTITRIGRKYAYVLIRGREVAFGIEDGIESSESNYRSRIGTLEEFQANDARAAAIQRVAELTRRPSWGRGVSTETLTRIADIIEASKGDLA